MSPQPLFVAATTSYAVNCALGASVAAGVVDTRRFRWVHHALYIATCTLAGAAAASAVLPALRPAGPAAAAAARHAALALAPAAVPLVVIPRVSARTARHPLVALTAAPFLVAGLMLSRR
ncbi:MULTISPECIES: hypothetical protein [Herbiconiux]|uniref:Uncharacterized protein n=1 Tax=Herbiconiux flava TaxID=881268 RepID=A0A852SPH5_9MICO|nr:MULTISPECIES: hypothetical protein [Herbiconiux]NQX36639.1 hypothetical protein [Herbiconiux sp. VKM Ac-2851]NYD70778.1 hypothetical protein [Herbiconiux flava]GLK17538.1 hypothetical protein GCM10017602_20200 [Herbiconiux flava]